MGGASEGGAAGHGASDGGAAGASVGTGGTPGSGGDGSAGVSGSSGAGGDSSLPLTCTTDEATLDTPSPLPVFCPNELDEYNVVEGTDSRDVYCDGVLTAGDDLVFGRIGSDVILASTGNDCMVGGRGQDRLEHGVDGDGVDVLYGGTGADTFAMVGASGYAVIVDFVSEDRIVFAKAAFGLSSVSGSTLPASHRALASENLDETQNSNCTGEGACIVYDATDGEIYYDADGSGPGLCDRVAVLGSYGDYSLDWSDFVLED